MRPYSKYLTKVKSEKNKARYNLSGTTPPLDHAELIFKKKGFPIDLTEVRNARSYTSVKKKIARKSLFKEENIEFFAGTSQAIFQIFAGLTEPGDTVAIETPTYSPVIDIARFLGLKILRFERTKNFKKDINSLSGTLKRAKLAFLTNPHCPSGYFLQGEQIRQLEKLKKPIILDEIYLPLFSPDQITLVSSTEKNLISISGFSKSVGVSSVRLSWALGNKTYLEKAALMGFNLTVDLPTPSFAIADEILDSWDEIVESITSVVEKNRKTLFKFINTLGPYLSHDLKRGYFVMLRMPRDMKTEENFISLLRKNSIFLRPGSDFEMKNHFRLHLMASPKDFKKVIKKLVQIYESKKS